MPEPRLSMRAVARTYRGGAGIHGVDLEVGGGQIHALVGLNGAGKSTLMRLALGMLRPSAGIVEIDGRDIRSMPAAAWAEVGHLVEVPLAYPELTVRENLVLGARLHAVSAADARTMVEAIVTELGLQPYADRRSGRLSLGNRQRLGVASALQHDPALIVLDEPTNGLDPSGVILLREALLRRAASGAGILVSSHHLDEVARIADRITVLHDGVVVGELDPAGADLERALFAIVLEHDRRPA